MPLSSSLWKITALAAAIVTSTSTVMVQAEEPATVKIEAQDLKLEVPKSWNKQEPSSSMRLAQFAIVPAAGDSQPGELVVSGPFGGSVGDNVKRWVAQFQPTDRTASITQGEAPQGKYIIADLAGIYNKPDGAPFLQKTKPVEGYRMLAVMLITEKGNYFVKLTGPKATIDAAATDFRKSFGGDASKEEKYEF